MKRIYVFIVMIVATFMINPSGIAQVSLIEGITPCLSIEELTNLKLPDVTITIVEKVFEGNPHCRILGVIGREIKFELLMPDIWNARFVMGGGGGFCGSVLNEARSMINKGYATSGTDTGHEGTIFQGDWALNNMERQVNYAHLAIHRTAEVSKAIINAYYGQFPDFNYFHGCSFGGNQAIAEAQRYPDDFDGIVAGAPGFGVSGIMGKFIRNSQIMFPDPDNTDVGIISEAQFALLQESILEQFDEIDGIKDNILNDPRDCKFNYSSLPRCSGNLDDTLCFTTEQIEAIKTLFAEFQTQGKVVHPGYPLGSELDWWKTQYLLATEWFKYIVFNDPNWDYSSFDFSNYFNDIEFMDSNFSVSSTDYSAFSDQGGKIIIYHGWNDGAMSAIASIEHFEAVKKRDPSADDYMKLYLLPGVNHCRGGPGPDQADWIEIIRNWVEHGNPPDRIVVSKIENDNVFMTRPVYPYPRKAVYDGFGNPNVESSFIEKK